MINPGTTHRFSIPIRRYGPDVVLILSLGGAVLIAFWRISVAGRVLAGGDLFTYFYPYWAEATRAIQAGRLPLWNPYLFMAAPFLANSQAGVFYPLNWPLWWLMPAHRSLHWTLVLHLWLATAGGYLWGRSSLRLGRVGGTAVGLAWGLGGYLGAQVEHVNQLQGLAWLPLMLSLTDRCVAGAKGRTVAGLSLVVGLVLLAGHTQTAFISLVGAAIYGLGPIAWQAIRQHQRRRERLLMFIRPASRLLMTISLGGMLAAVQVVPTWELSRLSIRAGGLPFNERVSFSLSPLYVARALLPGYTTPVPPEQIEYVAYVGIVGLALAWLGAGNSRSPVARRRAIGLLIGIGLSLSLGFYNPIYLVLARYVPGFAHFRVPARWLALYGIGMAGLIGQGVDSMLSFARPTGCIRARLAGPFGLLAGLLVLMAWAYVGTRGIPWQTIAIWGAVSLGCVGMVRLLQRGSSVGRIGQIIQVVALAALVAELVAASTTLPHSQATAPQAFTSLRPAIAHLLATTEHEGTPAGRLLSFSDITFDPGDLAEIEIAYGPQLSDAALYEYIVATKQKEVLTPNLPLAFRVPAVDGYDGGVLPLARYVTLQRLLLPPATSTTPTSVSMDGRLRENLTAIPEGRWLNLLGVQYLITDKLHDAWLDDVFYDLQFTARLTAGEAASVAYVPHFEATALGIVSYLDGGETLPDGAPVGRVEIGFTGGERHTFVVRAGQQTAEGIYGPEVHHAQAVVGGHFWSGQPEGNDYVTRMQWDEPATPTTIQVQASLVTGTWVVRGVSLIDERTGSFQALVLSNQGRYRQVHSGDVKIYQNLDALPRAFLVPLDRVTEVTQETTDREILERMQAPDFDPATEAILVGDAEHIANIAAAIEAKSPPSEEEEGGRVQIRRYTAEQIEIEVNSQEPAILLLTDAWYPGWQALANGRPVPIYRADLLFRAVPVGPGVQHITLTFRPLSLLVGLELSGVAVIGLLLTLLSATRSNSSQILWDAD